MSNLAFAEIGKVLKIAGGTGAFLTRGNDKIELAPDLNLELNDVISSEASYVVIQIYPGSQLSLAKNTAVKLSDHFVKENDSVEKAWSVVDFIKGTIRAKLDRDKNQDVEQKIETEGVAFAIRGTEFEISIEENKDVDLDVFEGEVAVSSPYIQSFVPEIVKADEGFRFERQKKAFLKRRFAPKFRNHPGFENSSVILKKWREKKANRKAKASKKKAAKKDRRNKKNK